MATAVECPHCGKQLRIKAEMAGRKGKCPHCQKTFELTAPLAAVGAASSAQISAQSPPLKAPPLVAAPPPKMAASRPTVQTPIDPEKLRQQISEAFHGKMTPPRVGVLRKFGALLVLGILLLMPVFYGAVILTLVYGMYWLTSSSIGRTLSPAVFWLMEAALCLILLCLLKALIEPQHRAAKVHAIDPNRDTLLLDFVAKVCDQIDAAPPKRIQLECSSRSDATSRGLTLGLPLVACLSIEQLAALIAGQMALRRRRAACGPTNLIRGINGWLWQSVYGRSRLDQWLTIVAERPYFHSAKLLLPLRATKLAPQAVLFVPMFIANTVGGFVVRRAELDADLAAARLVGRQCFAGLLERMELIEFSWEGVLAELDFLHKEQALPDNLPQQLALRMLDASPEVVAALRETVHEEDDKPFDARASSSERLAAIEAEQDDGLFRCSLPARSLLADYDATARQITWDYYAARFGPQLLKTGLKPVVMP